MPTCYYCNIWYDNPEIDNMTEGEFYQWMDDGHDADEFDCRNKERHGQVEKDSEFQSKLQESLEE